MLCQCAKLTPLQSRFLASVLALATIALIYWSLSNPHFAYAAELERDGTGSLRSGGGNDHNWHRIDVRGDVRGDLEEEHEWVEVEGRAEEGDGVDVDESGNDVPSRVLQERAPTTSTISGNNQANTGTISSGDTVVWKLPQSQLQGRDAGSDIAEAIHAELRKRGDDAETDVAEQLAPRQAGGEKTIFVSINTCSQPTDDSNGSPQAPPPQLTLYVATSGDNHSPGPNSGSSSQAAISLDEGYANHTNSAQGDWYMSVHAPDLPNGFKGDWQYELAVSTDDFFHSLGKNGTNLFLIDSDSTAALLVSNNLTQANASDDSYKDWMKRTPPFIIFASKADDPSIMGIQKSYCGLSKHSQIIGSQDDLDGGSTNVQMEMITRGLGNKPKEQFYVTNLDNASQYRAILARPGASLSSRADGDGSVGGGGEVFQPVSFATKADNNCALLYNLTFCDQVAYAVPSSPDAVANFTAFTSFWDNYTTFYYNYFNYSLQQIPCTTTPDAQYSLAKTCSDCAEAYKTWLCAVSIPRCEDFGNPAPYLQIRNLAQPFLNGSDVSPAFLNTSFIPMPGAPTLDGSLAFQQTLGSSYATLHSRNPQIDAVVKPGPYKEVLPCDDLCYSLVQSCPAALGFGCPHPGRGLEVSYGNRTGFGRGVVSCSFLGAYVYTDAASGLAPALIWIFGLAGLIGVMLGL